MLILVRMKAGLSVTEYQCVPGLAWGAGYVRVVDSDCLVDSVEFSYVACSM